MNSHSNGLKFNPFVPLILVFLIVSYSDLAPASDLKVHCKGQGSKVYLVGGGPAFTSWNLQPIQDTLSRHYRVCRWDMRGVGDNAAVTLTRQRLALSQWLDDMHAVLPVEPVMLWGHSWGALQVALFAKHHPRQVAGVILSNPVDPALLSLENIEVKRFNHSDTGRRLALEEIGTPAEALHNLHSKIASYFADARQGWAYAEQFSHSDTNNELNVRIWDEYRKAPLTEKDIRALAPKIAGLIYCQDDVLQPENLTEYQRLLPNNEHHVLKGCAHFPWEENSRDYYQVLLRYIK